MSDLALRLAFDESNDRAFEEAKVRVLLKAVGATRHLAQVRRASRQLREDRDLSFDGFLECFPSFPFKLCIDRLKCVPLPDKRKKTSFDYAIHMDLYSTEPSRFKNFEATPMYCAYRVAASEHRQCGRPVGVVVPRKGLVGGLVLYEGDDRYWTTGLSWVYKLTSGGQLYIRPFTQLLAGIVETGWSADNNVNVENV